MNRFIISIIILMTLSLAVGLLAGSAHAQVVEITEAKAPKPAAEAKDEKLAGLCLTAVESYEAKRKEIDERILYLENVAIMGDMFALKDEMEAEKGLPKMCAKEVEGAIDYMIEEMVGEKLDNIEVERMKHAAEDMESELMPKYLELSDLFDDVCVYCGKKPLKLAGDPLSCRAHHAGDEGKKIKCSEAQVRYENAREALLYRRDLCRQSAKLDGMDQILFWFQGRDDLPLACAVYVKAFMEDLRKKAEGASAQTRYAFTVAQEKCGRALFPIYMRYGMSVKSVCESCKNASGKLKNGTRCY